MYTFIPKLLELMTASYCCSSMVNYTFMSSSEFTNVHIRTKFAGAHEEKRTKQQRRPVALPSMLPIFVFILYSVHML